MNYDCTVCGLEPSLESFGECAKCLTASAIATNLWPELERLYRGAPFFEGVLRLEHARQCAALACVEAA
jgi:hypothetical protein